MDAVADAIWKGTTYGASDDAFKKYVKYVAKPTWNSMDPEKIDKRLNTFGIKSYLDKNGEVMLKNKKGKTQSLKEYYKRPTEQKTSNFEDEDPEGGARRRKRNILKRVVKRTHGKRTKTRAYRKTRA